MTTPAIAPAEHAGPGIYPGIDMEIYHRWDAASNSRLTQLLRSPAHLKAYMEGAWRETDAQRIGRAAHTAILEPDLFTSRYVQGSGEARRSNAAKEAWAALELQYGVGNVLKPDEYAGCLQMRDAIHSRRAAANLLKGIDRVELSILWSDEATGTLCKGRLDGYSPAMPGGVIVDLKSTEDASPRAFERSIHKWGYHRQAAHYLEGAKQLGLPAESFVVIAFEKEPPYAVAVYRIIEGALDAGAQQLHGFTDSNGRQITGLIPRYAECTRRGEWPAYPDTVRDIALPPYAWAQIEEEMKGWDTYPAHPDQPTASEAIA